MALGSFSTRPRVRSSPTVRPACVRASHLRSYPARPGTATLPVAVCVSRVNDYQRSYLFYDKPMGTADAGASTVGGLPKAKLLCSVDHQAVGFAQSNVGSHPCTVPGTVLPTGCARGGAPCPCPR